MSSTHRKGVSPLREEVATIKLLLASITSPLMHADLCASSESTEQESSMVVDDDEVVEFISKGVDKPIVDKAL
jgi:hypothetical protein